MTMVFEEQPAASPGSARKFHGLFFCCCIQSTLKCVYFLLAFIALVFCANVSFVFLVNKVGSEKVGASTSKPHLFIHSSI